MEELDFLWSRPAGLAALLLPVLLLLLARIRTKPPDVPTGTFALWQRIAAALPSEARSHRPRIPLTTWILALALLSGALALAGPRFEAPAGPRTWTVIVDRSPSTSLPWVAPGAKPVGEQGETRLARALDAARSWLSDHAGAADRLRWVSPGREDLVTGRGGVPSPDWLAVGQSGAPRLAGLDRPGAMLVTDRTPVPKPAVAGWFAGGGGAVPGPVAADAEGLLVWDGDAVIRRPDVDSGGRVVLDDREELPREMRDVIAAWAAGRRIALAEGAVDGRLVVTSAAPSSEIGRAEVGRDGWRAEAQYGVGEELPDAERAWTRWLEAPDGSVLIWSAPGRIHTSLFDLAAAPGDPAIFALSWARLLDQAMLPHALVVPLEDRTQAGAASTREPETPPEEPIKAASVTRMALDAWLAGLAAFLALVALALER